MKIAMARRRKNQQRGMTLIELMIAITILTVGLCALIGLIMTAAAGNNRNRVDTTGTFVTQIITESIVNQPGGGQVNVKDCAGNVIAIATIGPAAAGTSLGANLKADNTGIDFTQAVAGIPVGYKGTFVSCGTGGRTTTYDVRWNIRTISTNSRMVTVSARHTANAASGVQQSGVFYETPVNLRTILTK